jgi:hypothetical protein
VKAQRKAMHPHTVTTNIKEQWLGNIQGRDDRKRYCDTRTQREIKSENVFKF